MNLGDPVIDKATSGGIYYGEYRGRTKTGRLRVQIAYPHPWLVITKEQCVVPSPPVERYLKVDTLALEPRVRIESGTIPPRCNS